MEVTKIKNVIVNDLRKEIENVINNKIKLSNNSRTLVKDQQPYLQMKYNTWKENLNIRIEL